MPIPWHTSDIAMLLPVLLFHYFWVNVSGSVLYYHTSAAVSGLVSPALLYIHASLPTSEIPMLRVWHCGGGPCPAAS